MLIGVSRSWNPGSSPTLSTLQLPSTCVLSFEVRRRIDTLDESTPNDRRPLSKSNAPSMRPCSILLSWREYQMRWIWVPNCSGGNAGLTTPLTLLNASSPFGEVGYQVRAMIGRPVLNQYSCAQLPPQYGPPADWHALVPAKENAVELAP